jgi:hypothetical protein
MDGTISRVTTNAAIAAGVLEEVQISNELIEFTHLQTIRNFF